MEANRGISPALSQLEVRIGGLEKIQRDIHTFECDMLCHKTAIESIEFNLEELRVDERFSKVRIKALLDAAREEGFDDAYLERFLRDHRCNLV